MTISRDAVSEALHKAVAEKGEDYVYPSAGDVCRYTEPGEAIAPSCIVGYVVAEVDPAYFRALHQYEEGGELISARDLNNTGSKRLKSWSVDERALEALQAAQSLQDDAYPWGYAQEAFDRVLAGESAWDVKQELYERSERESENIEAVTGTVHQVEGVVHLTPEKIEEVIDGQS